MADLYNIYCDESTHLEADGQPYMLYGYIKLAYPAKREIDEQIKRIKKEHSYTGELKWINISNKTLPLYVDIINLFFGSEYLQFRTVVVDKSQIDNSRPEYTFNDFYFRMYYQLIHQKIDLENNYNIYFDIKDTNSQKKLHKLRDILKYNASIRNFQFIRSNESHYMQIADILMGAVNYNLRIKKNHIAGSKIAKMKILELIKRKSGLNLDCTTYKEQEKFNLFFIRLQ